jgi:hypothetical protein
MMLPAYLDRYLATKAFGGQQTREPTHAGRADNLMTSVRSLHRTRGRFGSEAQDDAIVVDGPIARVAPLVIGAFAVLAAGLVAGSSLARPRAMRRLLRRPLARRSRTTIGNVDR